MTSDVLVSFSLYGTDPEDVYYRGAVWNSKIYADWQPSWSLRFYCGDSVPDSVKKDIVAHNDKASIVEVHGPENASATTWRFGAVDPCESFGAIIFRDCDSRPIERERRAVEEWLAEDPKQYRFHVMRDHPWHARPMLAGLWGIRTPAYHDIFRRGIVEHGDHPWQIDQDILYKKVWPVARRYVLSHVGCMRLYERIDMRRPFPVPREEKRFVGQGFYGDGRIRFPGHEDMVEPDSHLFVRNRRVFLRKYDGTY